MVETGKVKELLEIISQMKPIVDEVVESNGQNHTATSCLEAFYSDLTAEAMEIRRKGLNGNAEI